MKSRALNIGFLRLMTSAIDAPEVFVAKSHFFNKGGATSNLPSACQPRFLPLPFFKVCNMKLFLVEWVVWVVLSMKPGIFLIAVKQQQLPPYRSTITYFLTKEK